MDEYHSERQTQFQGQYPQFQAHRQEDVKAILEQQEKITKISTGIYGFALILCGVLWLIYFKCIRRSDADRIRGIIHSTREQQIDEKSYFRIVPTAPKPEDMPDYPTQNIMMPGLIAPSPIHYPHHHQKNFQLQNQNQMSSLRPIDMPTTVNNIPPEGPYERPPSYNTACPTTNSNYYNRY